MESMQGFKRIAVLFFCVTGSLGVAGETFTGLRDFGSDGLLWKYQSQTWTDNQSVSWIHTLAGFNNSSSLTEGTLPIEQRGGKYGWYGNGRNSRTFSFGRPQTGFSRGGVESFSPLPQGDMIDSVEDSVTDFSFQNGNGRYYRGGSDGWRYSGSNDYPGPPYDCTPGPAPVPPANVPAPSAIILAGLGTLFVGFLRGRKNMHL